MSSPTGGAESIHLMYLLALTVASRSIPLSMAYFVPDVLALRTLIAALKRGVKVQIIMPSPTGDATIVRRASRARWGELLAAGAASGRNPPRVERGAKSSDKCPHRQPRTRGLRRLFASFANQGLRCK